MLRGCHWMMELILYTSAFCAPCVRARSVLRDAGRLLPQATIPEVDVLSHLDESQAAGIISTPTLVVRRDGTEVYRASGVPSVQHVLVAAALALDQEPRDSGCAGAPVPLPAASG